MRKDFKKKAIYIVGAGISGATLARLFAEKLNRKVIILEKRSHIAGNCYDFLDSAIIRIPLYGPHFFHTNSEQVWRFVSRFASWTPYEHRVLSRVKKKLVPVPVNRTTVNALCDTKLTTDSQMQEWLDNNTAHIPKPRNSEEAALNRVGKMLYELLFKNYTKKQWDIEPTQLGPEVMNRIPVRINTDDRYFTDQYQAMPTEGYTSLFENLLAHPNIELHLNTDYFSVKNEISHELLFYTGPVDAFFDYRYGKLQYRSLRFVYETLRQPYFQTRAQINYPGNEPFTRITEPKHATSQQSSKTTIITEFPTWDGDPYYPVLSPENKTRYQQYEKESLKLRSRGIYFVGRLAQYRYYNMDQAFENALNIFNTCI